MSETISDSDKKAIEDLLAVAHLAYDRGYLSGKEGNLSIRLGANRILSTASSTCKGRLRGEDVIFTDIHGALLERSSAGSKPSTELKMHLAAYVERPDIMAIVHAHPATAVGFTVAGLPLSVNTLPEIVCTLGSIPTAPYATPSTDEIPQSIEPLVKEHDAIMLAHHGSLTLGSDIWDAFYKLEALEQFAKTLLVASLLGGAKSLSPEQVGKLLSIRSVYGLSRSVKIL
ncbi:MAG: class II aldolase/adducin family protein [Candidatus Obscuribacterales bacterium]|nr:class II aldolase/adducin family protein [Candidatus Obscuribacterales bacterium]